MTVGALLVVIALVFAVLALFPTVDSRVLALSVILVCIALLVGHTQLDLR